MLRPTPRSVYIPLSSTPVLFILWIEGACQICFSSIVTQLKLSASFTSSTIQWWLVVLGGLEQKWCASGVRKPKPPCLLSDTFRYTNLFGHSTIWAMTDLRTAAMTLKSNTNKHQPLLHEKTFYTIRLLSISLSVSPLYSIVSVTYRVQVLKSFHISALWKYLGVHNTEIKLKALLRLFKIKPKHLQNAADHDICA